VPVGIVDPSALPPVPLEHQPRKIFFSVLDADQIDHLESLGYQPEILLTMPRSSHAEQVDYLLAKCQGIEEGTVEASRDQRLALVTMMQAYGLLDRRGQMLNINCNVTKETLEGMLNWGQSRHTLTGNSTVQNIPKAKNNERLRTIEANLREVDSK